MAEPNPPPPTTAWQTLAKQKREAVSSQIPKEWLLPSSLTFQFTESSILSVLELPRTCGLMTAQELDITEDRDATDLVRLMAKGELKSIDVVTAFCKRAAIAHQCTNCLTEIFFEAALERARECDAYFEKEGRTIGPLHGLPISLKDSFNVKGVEATLGYVSFLSRPPASHNSAVVNLLKCAGAVFYVKTNLPQTMMSADSHNNVFGRTLNPRNLSRTAGGSTGGEAALIAMGGSVLGVSTDVAGSNRIPALCCGIASIKPTACRIPFAGGVPPGRLGSPSPILPVAGPCARSVRDLALFTKTVIDARPWEGDENALNVPWRTVEPCTRPLRFGLLRGCKERMLHPPIKRALHQVATRLKGAGHGIVLLDEKIPSIYASALLAWNFFLLDPAATPLKHIAASGEPIVPSLSSCSFKELEGWKPTLDELFEMNVARAGICRAWREVMVQEGGELDAVIMPGYQGVAPGHDAFGVPIYTVLANLLNYPAGILPVGMADAKMDAKFVVEGEELEPPYDAAECEGMPTHVQIMGKPMMDEELLQILSSIEGMLKDDSG